ncbi:MAG: DNA polymerase III subunit alpha [Erysipelotrichales bacterium]|nr:DNA polymerase III subunit alpha [Erysipelotrichales bacterium]
MYFIPMHVYSEYSFLNSGLTMEKYFSFAKKNKLKYLGISDLNVMFGFPIFDSYAKNSDIKPLFGMDIALGRFLISLYIKNESGYLNLIKISNFLKTNELSYDFLKKHQDGLIIIISINVDNFDNSLPSIKKLYEDFNDVYVGLEIYSETEREKMTSFALELEKKYKLIAFPHIKYLNPEDAIVLDIVDAIKNNSTLDYQRKSGEMYLRKIEEIEKIFDGLPIIDSTILFNEIDFEFHKPRGDLLKFVDDSSSKKTLYSHCIEGLKKKNLDNNDIYLARLNYELDVINKMGYNNYFLIVEDYVKYAKSHDILVGPGRGSAAGSLVSFALNITTPDPIAHDLYFERFLNPNRKTMPDIDIDFEDIKREEIVNYLKEKYGKEKVANIVTFQTIGAKQALRDIGRVFKIDNFEINYLSKALGNLTTSFKASYKSNAVFKNLIDKEPHYLNIVRLASKIEGLIRQSSLHAAGVILNNENIENVLPVLKDDYGNLTTQYEMTYLEEQGFLKMDLLALRNLTIIKEICLKPTINLDPYLLPIDDELAIKIIHDNNTMGIFQLESAGMKKSIDILKPSSFNDIAALIALFRPGPISNIPTYALRKDGKEKVTYLNKTLEEILSSTYGIIIYQEQIIKIATDMAGLSLAEADNFRRSISKKDLNKMDALKDDFINGAIKNGYMKQDAENVFETIVKFASYGFNKAHSISYAYICSQMAYLKAHFPLEFYSVILEHESGFTSDKMSEYLREIRSQGIELLLPNINLSTDTFKAHEGKLLFPINAIRGIQTKIAETIINEREKNGKYIDFFDFVTRLYKQGISEAILINLINAGAFDDFANRATLRASIPNALNQASFNSTLDVSLLSDSDFGLHFDLIGESDDQLFNINQEYEALGIMISSSPLRYKKDALIKNNVIPVREAKNYTKSCKIGVLLLKTKVIKTKKGTQMAYLSCMDENSDIEVIVFPREYEKYWSLLISNSVLIIKGYFDQKDNESFIAEEIKKLED